MGVPGENIFAVLVIGFGKLNLLLSYVSPRTGKQYIVIAAGGHAFMHSKIGDSVVAYSLRE